MHPTLELAVTICPELTLLGGRLRFVWHPASSSVGMKKKKPHEFSAGVQDSVKIQKDFTEVLFPLHVSFMITIVFHDNGCAEFQELSTDQSFSSCYSAASSSDSAFLGIPANSSLLR